MDVVEATVKQYHEAEEALLDAASDLLDELDGPRDDPQVQACIARVDAIFAADPVLGAALQRYISKLGLLRSFAASLQDGATP
ncbi:MAG: hypothetical protein WEA10_04990 [Actinomycetota bacterium]